MDHIMNSGPDLWSEGISFLKSSGSVDKIIWGKDTVYG